MLTQNYKFIWIVAVNNVKVEFYSGVVFMINESGFLPCSDNWCVDGNRAWCVDVERNILYCINLQSREFEFMKEIPEKSTNTFRMNPNCIKYRDFIFCMPTTGNSIWIYQIKNSQFQQIKIHNPNGVKIAMVDFWQFDEKMYVVSRGLKQVFEINMEEQKIDNCYDLYNIDASWITKSIVVGKVIYSICIAASEIHLFDLETKSVSKYYIQNIKGGFETICFDGKNFWLSGCRKEIYVWNEGKDTVTILNNFPAQFGKYNIQSSKKEFLDCKTVEFEAYTVFFQSVAIGRYIWFVPLLMNKLIYVDKDSFEIFAFEIENEDETRETLMSRQMNIKFIMEYVREERYLGIFSTKNNCIIEIDALENKYEKNYFGFNHSFIENMVQMYMKHEGVCFKENDSLDRMAFAELLNMDPQRKKISSVSAGYSIYQSTLNGENRK